jgi:hypothetical protein
LHYVVEDDLERPRLQKIRYALASHSKETKEEDLVVRLEKIRDF